MKETSSLHRSTTEFIQASAPVAAGPAAAPTGLWDRLTARVRAWFEIPEGYEDENGFHYGPEPKPAWMTSPTEVKARQIFTDRATDAIRYASTLAPQPEEAPAPEHSQKI